MTIEDYVVKNYKSYTIKELADNLHTTPNEIKKVFRKKQLVSPFRYEVIFVNKHYSDASKICFKYSVKRILSLGLTNLDAIFNAAIIDYCLDTYHDINEAKEHFKDYYYTSLAPILNKLESEELYITKDLLNILAKNTKK